MTKLGTLAVILMLALTACGIDGEPDTPPAKTRQ